MRPEPILEISGLSKRYDHHPVLDDVSFSLEAGEIAVLAGVNGSGKSTLLRCLAGLTWCRGDVRVGGLALDGKKAVRRLLGYLPQAVQLPDAVTVGEVLSFFAGLRGVAPDELPLVEGFLPAGERPVGILSGGQRQRVAIAVALLGRPPLLLLDEPVANLDEHGREAFWETLRGLRDARTTALIASPLPGDLAGVAERAIVLSDGRVAFDGPMEGVRSIPAPRVREARGDGSADDEEARA